LQVKHDEPLSNFAFNLNLRHYTGEELLEAMRLALEIPPCAAHTVAALLAPHMPRVAAEGGAGLHVHMRLMMEAAGSGIGGEDGAAAAFNNNGGGACWGRLLNAFQRLTLVHFSAQPEIPVLPYHSITETI